MDRPKVYADDLSESEQIEMEQRVLKMQGTRKCGPCTACCTVQGVAELQKPTYTRCCHQNEGGCAIYSARPASCRLWSCDWLLGLEPGGDERHRPDNLGLIFTHEMVGKRGWALAAYEVWPGAGREFKGRYLLRKLARDGQLVLLHSNGGEGREQLEVICPAGCEQQAAEIAKEIQTGGQLERERRGQDMLPVIERLAAPQTHDNRQRPETP